MADPTRDGAFALLSGVLDARRSLDEGLSGLPSMAPRDRAAGHRLAAMTLRRLGTLDAVLEPFLRKAPPDPVRHVLRLGAAGLLLLDTPAHAAVNTAVALAERRGLRAFGGLVNAVLRRLGAAGPAALEGLDGPRLDTPGWLWASWGASARAIALGHQQPAPLDLTVRAGAEVPGGMRLPTGSVRFPEGTDPTALPGFAEGAFWVQDVAASLPARLLAVHSGERVADLCAAPGGKTAQLAVAGAQVTALDRDPARMARLRENLARLGLKAETIVADAVEWRPGESFDAVLLDAPCSATGTIRRHPDIPHLKRPRDVAAAGEVQSRLLDAAVRMLRLGGRLVYAVCSLQPEEGPALVERVLNGGLVQRSPFDHEELRDIPEARTQDGSLRTHPGLWADRGRMDGFFAARMVRVRL